MTAPPESPPRPPVSAPTAGRERALAPDVARGFMLLFIILANSTLYLVGEPDGILFRPITSDPADRVADVLGALFIDNRSFPMFAFLFGYGVHQLASREAARGTAWPQARNLMLRRNAWLLAIGVVHFALLFFGDIITAYAIAGFLLIALVRAPAGVLWGVTATSLVLFFPLLAASDAGSASGLTAVTDTDLGALHATTIPAAIAANLEYFLSSLPWLPMSSAALLPPMVLGLLLGRLRLLEEPWRHPRLARWLAWGGIALGILGALPFAVGLAVGYEAGPEWLAWSLLHSYTGVAAGIGYAVLIALLVAGAQRRRLADPQAHPGLVIWSLSALGRRSLSGYIAQTLFSIVLFPAYGLGIGYLVGSAGIALIAIGIWLVTVVLAALLERAGRPGPLEWLHRRLTYGRSRAQFAAGENHRP